MIQLSKYSWKIAKSTLLIIHVSECIHTPVSEKKLSRFNLILWQYLCFNFYKLDLSTNIEFAFNLNIFKCNFQSEMFNSKTIEVLLSLKKNRDMPTTFGCF